MVQELLQGAKDLLVDSLRAVDRLVRMNQDLQREIRPVGSGETGQRQPPRLVPFRASDHPSCDRWHTLATPGPESASGRSGAQPWHTAVPTPPQLFEICETLVLEL